MLATYILTLEAIKIKSAEVIVSARYNWPLTFDPGHLPLLFKHHHSIGDVVSRDPEINLDQYDNQMRWDNRYCHLLLILDLWPWILDHWFFNFTHDHCSSNSFCHFWHLTLALITFSDKSGRHRAYNHRDRFGPLRIRAGSEPRTDPILLPVWYVSRGPHVPVLSQVVCEALHTQHGWDRTQR